MMILGILLALYTVVFGGGIAIYNFDRILVSFLCLINAPVCEEARRLADLIYQQPGQWKLSSDTMNHPRIGEIWGTSARSLHVEGPGFGRWDPNFIERRIIYNAIAWYRRVYIKGLLTQVLNAPPALNVTRA